MRIEEICLVGAGGHGKVVLDALFAAGVPHADIQLYDNSSTLANAKVFDIVVQDPENRCSWAGSHVHVAIGDNVTRRKLAQRFHLSGALAMTVTHPAACLSSRAIIGPGCYLAAKAIVGPGAIVGCGVIANHSAVLDHDCIVGDFAHIAPNATLGGNVRIGADVLIGAGAIILPGITIGRKAVIGAGALVLRDVAPGEIWVGLPAHSLRKA